MFEKILGKKQKINGFDGIKEYEKFKQDFEDKELELLVLTKIDRCGGTIVGNYILPSFDFYAAIDIKTGEFFGEAGRLVWMIKNEPKRGSWGYEIKELTIYQVRVRKCIPKELGEYLSPIVNNRYMLLEILDENVAHPKLDEIKHKKEEKISFKDDVLGEFILDREFSWFEGDIDWLGNPCTIYLETDEEDGETADKAFEVLKELYYNIKQWDNKLREFAAEELTALANDWQDDADREDADGVAEITKEEFAKRIGLSEVTISPEGDMTIYFYDDEMFWGHSIVLDANINGEIDSADIAG